MADRMLQTCGRRLRAVGRRLCLRDCTPPPSPCCIEREVRAPTFGTPPNQEPFCEPDICTPGLPFQHCLDACVPHQIARLGKRIALTIQAQGISSKSTENLFFPGFFESSSATWNFTFTGTMETGAPPGCAMSAQGLFSGQIGMNIRIGFPPFPVYNETRNLPVVMSTGPFFRFPWGHGHAPDGMVAMMPPAILYNIVTGAAQVGGNAGTFGPLNLLGDLLPVLNLFPNHPAGGSINTAASYYFIASDLGSMASGFGIFTDPYPWATNRMWCAASCSGSEVLPSSPASAVQGTRERTWSNQQTLTATSIDVMYRDVSTSPSFFGEFTSTYQAVAIAEVLEPCDDPPPTGGGGPPGTIGLPGPHFGGDPRVFGLTKEANTHPGCCG